MIYIDLYYRVRDLQKCQTPRFGVNLILHAEHSYVMYNHVQVCKFESR